MQLNIAHSELQCNYNNDQSQTYEVEQVELPQVIEWEHDQQTKVHAIKTLKMQTTKYANQIAMTGQVKCYQVEVKLW